MWKKHTAQKWVPNIVTVVDKPEQTVKYSVYKMYWYTTGTWEETRDPDGFHAWAESKEGSLYPLYYPYQKPEDNRQPALYWVCQKWARDIYKRPHDYRAVR
ncbi:hypothetical protein [Hydrogeniiclostridium mannosilyticum]|uniref:hypothetical protein n=1 Tax=Hydrogeniiclostridium mannosilyticum TaxID=2764322 RepID=UPI001C0A75BD|nr:hypothetical protein [Hydrogeniiclostridium mannosilyticum]